MSGVDAYYTPDWLVRLCCERVLPAVAATEPKRILEPGAGDGAFVRRLREKYRHSHITAIDIQEHPWPEADVSLVGDFLTTPLERYDLAVGNPPFSLALDFIERCLRHSASVVVLLRQGFLSSARRVQFWRSIPPSHVFVIPNRPSFTADGKGDSADYCFCCWRLDDAGATELRWLPALPKAERRS